MIADRITDFYIKKNYIPKDKKEIYSYGFKLIISDIINFSIVLALGTVFGRIYESILFLITLCTVRRVSGGFHAKSFWLCRPSLIITFLGVLVFSEFILRTKIALFVSVVINIISFIIIASYSPIKHLNKNLTEEMIHGVSNGMIRILPEGESKSVLYAITAQQGPCFSDGYIEYLNTASLSEGKKIVYNEYYGAIRSYIIVN